MQNFYQTCAQAIHKSRITDKMVTDHKKIDRLQFDDHLIWIKRSEATRSNIFHKMFYRLSRLKVLIPVEHKTAHQSLEFEVSKLKSLAAIDVPVPRVVGHDTQFLFLKDTGTDLRQYLKNNELSQTHKEKTIIQALMVLCQIHNSGNYHAGAQIKNYTISEQGISAIDFEDSFANCYSLEDIQFRDFFLFLFSLTTISNDVIYQEAIDVYLSKTGNENIKVRLKKIARTTIPLLKTIEFLSNSKHLHLGHDVMGAYTLLSFLAGI
ncbi:MAG: hypothetical protein CENE_03185 [Candidatus Celerinatantimonas neptuna]|nr:MAG: hypothetical protein CENE_03185 [Candidatus Celerinatantimonas neptuna]